MLSKKELLIFFAGAAAFHAFEHILIPMLVTLPMQFGPINLTRSLNIIVIIISTLISVGLIMLANKK